MIHGVINIYKERGFTSHDVVGKLRGILRQKKIGHTGTLDPDAEGVLPVCLGKATKLCDLLTDKEKTYRAVLLLGKTTDTQDVSGTVLSEVPVTAEEEKVREAILSFVGDYDQIPPMYSALKVNGQKLCDLARAGKEVERKPRRVTIREIRIEKIPTFPGDDRVTMLQGTYTPDPLSGHQKTWAAAVVWRAFSVPAWNVLLLRMPSNLERWRPSRRKKVSTVSWRKSFRSTACFPML